MNEQLELPVGTFERILEARNYAAYYFEYERSQRPEGYEQPMLKLVRQIEHELAQEEIDQQEETNGKD